MDLARIALFVAVCLADGLFLLKVAPAAAAEIISNVAPPPTPVENPGRHHDGYTWAPGHWDWNGQSYRWIAGSWIVEHGKAHWVADQWEPMEGSQWRYLPGHWEH